MHGSLMRDLVRTWQRVEADTPWGVVSARPPTLREALAVLAAAQIAEDDPEEAMSVLHDALASWLPLRLSSLMTSRAYPAGDALSWALQAIEANAPEPADVATEAERSEAEAAGDEASWQDINWSGRIADYCAAYGTPPDDVLEVPFGRFLVMLERTRRIHAREQLRRLRAQALPYADEKGRSRALDRLAEEAGYSSSSDEDEAPTSGMSEEEAIEWQKEQLARMNRRLGRTPNESTDD